MVQVMPSLTRLNVRELIEGCHRSFNNIGSFVSFELMGLLKLGDSVLGF